MTSKGEKILTVTLSALYAAVSGVATVLLIRNTIEIIKD